MGSAANKNSQRQIILDIVKVIALILMFWSHVYAFTSTYSHNYLSADIGNKIRFFSDTVCFTTFLLASGASTFLAYMKLTDFDGARKKRTDHRILKRNLQLLFGYYFLALLSNLFLGEKISSLTNIILLINIPAFTEFLLPFIIYGFLILILRKSFKRILDHRQGFFILLTISGLGYWIGSLLFNWKLDYPFENIKALLAGSPNILSYPVLQYLPVFLLGLWLGKLIDQVQRKKIPSIFFDKRFLVVCLMIFFFAIESNFNQYLKLFPYSNPIDRWPPTLAFLGRGLSFCFLIFIIFDVYRFILYNKFLKAVVSKKIFSTKIIQMKSAIKYISSQVFNILIIHQSLLFCYRLFINRYFSDIKIVILIYLSFFVISIGLCFLLGILFRFLAIKQWMPHRILFVRSDDSEKLRN
jgi:hypothetical protein